MRKPKFNIRDEVYHITPESPKGIVIDVRYSFLTGLYTYEVAFSAETASLEYQEHELTDHKIF